MSFDSAFETFGISGIVLFGLCSLTYKIHQNFIFSIASHDFLNKYNPQKTLWEIWENGNSINSGIPNDHWNKYNYGKKVEHEGFGIDGKTLELYRQRAQEFSEVINKLFMGILIS